MPNTFTPNLNLAKPADGDGGWGDEIRGDLDIVDALFPGGQAAIADGSIPLAKLDTDVATQAELDAHALVPGTTTAIGHVELATDGESAAGLAVQANDGRLTNGRPALGTAGGVLNGSYPNPGFALDMATQAELDAEVTARTSGDAARPTGVAGTAGRAAFYSAADTLAVYANSIFWNAASSWVGIGTDVPTAPLTLAYPGLANPTFGSAFASAITYTVPLAGTSNVHALVAEYDPTAAHSGTRIWCAIRASSQIRSTVPGLTLGMTLRAMNAVCQNLGSAIITGTTAAQFAQVTNASTGQIANANALLGIISNTSTGTITLATALRAQRPTGTAGGSYGDIYGLYIENQQPSAGTLSGVANGIYQEGTADLNTYKGLSQFDGKATFNGGTAGIPRDLSWYYDGALAVATAYGPLRRISAATTIQSAYAVAKSAPAGSALDFDIKWSANGATGWASIFSTRPTISAGAVTSTAGTLSKTTFAAGDYVRLDIIAAGGTPAQGVTFDLVMVTR